jgi:hypothetical protein
MLLEFLAGFFIGQVASNVTGGGVLCLQGRVLRFQVLKLIHKLVVLVVADNRGVIHIIPAITVFQHPAQSLDSLLCLLKTHISAITHNLTQIVIFSLNLPIFNFVNFIYLCLGYDS